VVVVVDDARGLQAVRVVPAPVRRAVEAGP
jgi:hypothetical protein